MRPQDSSDDPTDFSYSVTPPAAGRVSRRNLLPSPNRAKAKAGPARVRRDLNQVSVEDETKRAILGPDLMERPYLLAADGEWQFELRVSGNRPESWVRDPARRFEIQMFCLEITSP